MNLHFRILWRLAGWLAVSSGSKGTLLGAQTRNVVSFETGFTDRTNFIGPPQLSSGQSLWLQIHRSQVRFPALLDFLRSSSGTGSTQPREYS
jgi:hypothetical protein